MAVKDLRQSLSFSTDVFSLVQLERFVGSSLDERRLQLRHLLEVTKRRIRKWNDARTRKQIQKKEQPDRKQQTIHLVSREETTEASEMAARVYVILHRLVIDISTNDISPINMSYFLTIQDGFVRESMMFQFGNLEIFCLRLLLTCYLSFLIISYFTRIINNFKLIDLQRSFTGVHITYGSISNIFLTH